jgi:uncharacterized protein YidB (DUF937 family)
MSILDQVTSAVGGASGGNQNIVESIVGMIGGEGGLGGLVSKFQQGGLGDVVNSWVGTGANQSISTDQLSSVLGNGQLQSLAEKTGLPIEDITKKVSEFLPGIVDKLTPNGTVEGGNVLDQGMDMLKGLFN